MTKIEQMQAAIEKAERRESTLTPLALSVPALSSLNIRHVMNNLGAISNTYLECGSHRGGLFCSAICNNPNLAYACAIDNWASDDMGENAEKDFDENVDMIKSSNTRIIKIKADCFSGYTAGMYDLYLYDAGHSFEEQKQALTYEGHILTDEFVFCVDDFDWSEVKNGTMYGIREMGYEILFEKVFKGNDHDNEGWWNGFAVFLLKKKQ